MQSLREQTNKQVSTEVEALKAVQEDALDAVRVMTRETQAVSFPPVPRTFSFDSTIPLGVHQPPQQPQEKEG